MPESYSGKIREVIHSNKDYIAGAATGPIDVQKCHNDTEVYKKALAEATNSASELKKFKERYDALLPSKSLDEVKNAYSLYTFWMSKGKSDDDITNFVSKPS